MHALSSLGRARHAVQRWFASGDAPEGTRQAESRDQIPEAEPDLDQRIEAFMDEVKATSQEWLGRVRLVNFDEIKQRLGPNWPKLQQKVELLAERVIDEMLSARDLYLNIGEAEFLVFLGDASPEEVKIRCLAITEKIQEKLFGVNDEIEKSAGRFAECHVGQSDGMELELKSPQGHGQTSRQIMRKLFRPDAERLDAADITACAQTALDAIMGRAAESRDARELGSPSERLQRLSQDLKVLEPALTGAEMAEGALLLQPVWDDIGDLVSVLDRAASDSHAALLAALAKLRQERAQRQAGDAAELAPGAAAKDGRSFYYVPVYRSVAQGEQLFKGLYRVKSMNTGRLLKSEPRNDESDHHATAMAERLILQHALTPIGEDEGPKRFMLMVQVHVETLRRPGSLRKYSTLLRAAPLAVKRRLIIEISGYQEGDNSIGIRRAVEELRAHCHALFVSLSDEFGKFAQLAAECKRLGVRAVGLDLAHSQLCRAEIFAALEMAGVTGERQAIPIYLDGISSLPVLARAIAAGVSYFCAPALIPGRPEPEEAERITLNDLFTAI